MSSYSPKFKTLLAIHENAQKQFGSRPLFGTKKGLDWKWTTYSEFGRMVDAARSALDGLGVRKGDRVAIVSNNRPEWAACAYATYGLGAVFVAMYEAQAESDWKFILRDSGAKVVFVPGQVIASRILAVKAELPALEHVVVIEGPTDTGMRSFRALLEEGTQRPVQSTKPSPEDTACLIYTSGTTGNPKGVVLSHANVAYNVSAIHEFFPLAQDDRSLCFLPWAHVFGQTVELHGLYSLGASIALVESVDRLVANLVEVKPTILVSVPRIFNRIYDGLHRRMEQEGGLKKKLFLAALENAERRKEAARRKEPIGFADFQHKVFDAVVFKQVRAALGGNLKYAISGGAALSREVAEFIDNLGILVFEGYGLSETSPIVTANHPGARKIGSVGKVIHGVRVEIDTTVTGDPKNGEILVFGHNVMQGYYGLPEENAKVFVERNGERGFRTGDMGHFDGDGFLYITGRIKEQYKLLNGKYVVPTPIEESLKLSPFIANVMVYGDNREFNVAVVIPDFESLEPWARDHGIDTADRRALVANPKVKELLAGEIEKQSADLKQYEKVKKFVLGATDFTTDNGMLTPSLKMKRREVVKVYGRELDALY